MNIILIYITFPNKTEAKKVSKMLLNKKLAACVNFFPIDSMYWWKKKIVSEKEWVLLAKTKKDNYEKVRRAVEKIHPYAVPCITKITEQANQKYFNWIISELK